MRSTFPNLLATAALGLLFAAPASADDHGDAAKQAKASAKAAIGQPAPDFTLTSTAGEEHTLSSYDGSTVVLEWVNFDCPFVRKHYGSGNMPALQKEWMGKDVVWLTICSSAPGKQGHFEGDALAAKMEDAGWSATAYLVDTDGAVGKMYDAKTTPHMYVIDPEGTLVYAGAIDSKPTANPADLESATNYVQAALTAVMAGDEVETPESRPYGCSVKY